MSDTANLGRIAWYQLITKDVSAAHDFYAKVIGWDGPETPPTTDVASVWSQLQETTSLVTLDGNDELTPHWRAYFVVPNIEAACQRALMGGGEVYQPSTEVPNVGKIAVLGDIFGAIFAVVEPCEALPDNHALVADDGQFCWSELNTENYTLGFRFYEGIFHWGPGRAVNIPGGRVYQMFTQGEREIGGIMDLRRDHDIPPNWMHYIRVSSVQDTIEKAKAHGGSVVMDVHNLPDGASSACICDPQGAVFSIWSSPVKGAGYTV